jgi:hypothetical protein
MGQFGQSVAIPSGAVYPDGLAVTQADPIIQASVRPEGSYFGKSEGYETIRPGRSRFQHNKGKGIHFTATRAAENLSMPSSLPVMVDITTAPDHVDVADIPGSAELGPGGVSDEANRILLAESTDMASTGGNVRHAGTKTLPDMGDREAHRPLSQIFHGFADPVDMFRAQYAKNPTVAVGAAAVLVGAAYMIARDFERTYRSRRSAAASGGGVTAAAAPVGGGAAAAVDTSGNVVEKAADTVVAAGEAVADGAAAVVETAGSTVEKVTESAADAVTGKE